MVTQVNHSKGGQIIDQDHYKIGMQTNKMKVVMQAPVIIELEVTQTNSQMSDQEAGADTK